MPESSRRSLFWLVLLLLYGWHALAALQAERALWADGTYYLEQILENREFALGDESRATADVLLELPLVTLLNFGITDLGVLKAAFGVPSFVLIPTCLALCLWMAGPDKAVMGYPLATIAAGMMNTELLSIHESRVAHALFWPVLFALLDPLRRTSTLVVAAFLSIPLVASYESAVFLGPLLCYAAVGRFRGETDGGRRFAVAWCLFCAAAATLIAAESIARPTHPSNLLLFGETWRVLLGEGGPGVRLSLLALILCVPWLHSRRWLAIASTTVFALACAVLLREAFQNPRNAAVISQYTARILNVVLPPLVSFLFLVARSRNWNGAPSLAVLGVLFVAQVPLQLQLTNQWTVFRETMRTELACVRGLIPVDTALGKALENKKVSIEWMLGWHHPTLTYVDRSGPIRAVLGVYNGYTDWQPFYPQRLSELPQLSRYGVTDAEYRAAMEVLLRRDGPPWEAVSPCPGR
jgi:hypothetical protein